MPARKKSVLATMRKQVAFHARAISAVMPCSAVDNLQRQNSRGISTGVPSFTKAESFLSQTVSTSRVTKKTMKASKRKTTKTIRQPAVPVVESWARAGGVSRIIEIEDEVKTSTLGIARVATWRLPAFVDGLTSLLSECSEQAAVDTDEVNMGEEGLTDVFAHFESESAAQIAKVRMDGKLVGGRILQLSFA